jgi:hypothetical protein
MRGKLGVLLLSAAMILALTGCMREWTPRPQTEGALRLRIIRPEASTATVEPKVMPEGATKIRVRVWHAQTGYNVVVTVPLSGTGAELSLAIPEDDGYTVDVVSYLITEGRATALTGGRAPDVSVQAKETTSVEVTLLPWTTETSGDESVAPGDAYTVRMVATDADGLITLQTFESATLHASMTAFQTVSAALPPAPGTLGVVLDDRMSFTATAPNVTKVTTLYVAALVEFTRGWRDDTLADVAERSLFVELPNRHMGEPLHELVVDPTSGGVVIDITSLNRP